MSIRYYYQIYKKGAFVKGELYREYYPIINMRYWYCTAYFGMFIFLPAINKGIQYLNRSEFKLLVMSIYGIFVFWQTINSKKDSFILNGGHSTLWLSCLYIIGAYIGKFYVVYIGAKRYIFSLLYFFIFLILCFLFNQFEDYKISGFSENFKVKLQNFIIKLMSRKLNHVIRTTLAIFITLFFLQLKYHNYLSKFITFCGPLTFGVYLIHFNSNVVKNYLEKILDQESYNLTSNEVIKLLILKSLKLFIECIAIEYLRNSFFTILKIRDICLFIENFAFKIVS